MISQSGLEHQEDQAETSTHNLTHHAGVMEIATKEPNAFKQDLFVNASGKILKSAMETTSSSLRKPNKSRFLSTMITMSSFGVVS